VVHETIKRSVPADAVFLGVEDAPVQSFVPYLDIGWLLGTTPSLHFVRGMNDSSRRYESIWNFDDAGDSDRASRLFAWMWSRPDRWSVWGHAATGLGPAYLSGMVARETADDVLTEPATVDAIATWPADLDEGDDESCDPGSIWCACNDKGWGREKSYSIILYHEEAKSEPIFSLVVDRKGDRDRIWDFIKHQTTRYREFADLVDAHGGEALKKVIFASMLETERAVKKAGLGSGGLRPLRFWPGPESADA
jgi:hypothetical protein